MAAGVTQLNMFGGELVQVAPTRARPAPSPKPPKPVVAADPMVWRHHVGPFESEPHEEVVVPAVLPDGWRLVEDDYNAYVLKPPADFDIGLRGHAPRFPYYGEGRSREAALEYAEYVARRMVDGTWTSVIEVESHYLVGRTDFERFLEKWRSSGWSARMPAGGKHYAELLQSPGVLDQFLPEHQPPMEALQKATRTKQPKEKAIVGDDEDDGDN